jgi:hypothetical protein
MRWHKTVRQRPAVKRGMEIPKEKIKDEEEAVERGRKLLV